LHDEEKIFAEILARHVGRALQPCRECIYASQKTQIFVFLQRAIRESPNGGIWSISYLAQRAAKGVGPYGRRIVGGAAGKFEDHRR